MSDKTRTGWVYVLVNESIADQVKVGFTSGRPEDRAKELHTSGVPTPYQVATAFLFTDKAKQIEQRAHLLLKNCRVSSDREFFRCHAKNAAFIIKLAAKQLDQTPAAIEPVLLTPEEIAEQERQEVIQKQREEAQRRRRQAEEEERLSRLRKQKEERQELLRKQEEERERRLFEEEEKRKKKKKQGECGCSIGLLFVLFLVILFFFMVFTNHFSSL